MELSRFSFILFCHLLLQLLHVPLELCPSVLEPRYHLINDNDGDDDDEDDGAEDDDDGDKDDDGNDENLVV